LNFKPAFPSSDVQEASQRAQKGPPQEADKAAVLMSSPSDPTYVGNVRTQPPNEISAKAEVATIAASAKAPINFFIMKKTSLFFKKQN
jgi:hypothetical protein